ncbi:hypothetical protein VAPA_1c17250 [Variovorax paradoxus B4]|uniref:Uncharacterized protein n=1 Tax=Variovorax paradoxus B4 TaxID=1246301 RepID=T1X8F3_VARPD|nr:hypothetical protein VAPA_1c17250 [Variovorax paradoxus B4]
MQPACPNSRLVEFSNNKASRLWALQALRVFSAGLDRSASTALSCVAVEKTLPILLGLGGLIFVQLWEPKSVVG